MCPLTVDYSWGYTMTCKEHYSYTWTKGYGSKDNYWEQIDLFLSVEKREKQMKMDLAVDEIRKRFGFYSIQRGLMYRDRILSVVNAKEEHTVHPHGYFLG